MLCSVAASKGRNDRNDRTQSSRRSMKSYVVKSCYKREVASETTNAEVAQG